ncbi:MAG: carbon storage regulator [Gemmataceae bacterium]
MLVLSRKSGQIIRIGEQISVEIVEVKGNRVRLAIAAPQTIPILRGELEDRPTAAVQPRTTDSTILEP